MPDTTPTESTYRNLAAFDIDLDVFADHLRAIADGVSGGNVHLYNLESTERVYVDEDVTVELSFEYTIPEGREDLLQSLMQASAQSDNE